VLHWINITIKRLNRGLRTYLLQNNSYAIAHPDFDDSYSALCDDDGVHLSFIGKDIFINTIQEALLICLRYPNCNVYPMEHMITEGYTNQCNKTSCLGQPEQQS
jgi:hypothetical protein